MRSFFLAGQSVPWYVVAFGMVGSSLSGVSFISVPGDVGAPVVSGSGLLRQAGYLQVVLGYAAGYAVIALLLIPLYYRHGLTSIYGYLGQRIGPTGRKTAALLFVVSRTLGAALRLYLAVGVLQWMVFEHLGVPFVVTGAFTVVFIAAYTGKGGMQAVVWTDVLQTAVMIIALAVSVFFVARSLEISNPLVHFFSGPYGQVFFWQPNLPNFFPKQFLGGMFLAIVMTGLDQDMMQKNLTCRTARESQWNIAGYSAAIVLVSTLLVILGGLLYEFAHAAGLNLPESTDALYPTLAMKAFAPWATIWVVLGLVAAAYNSADGSLTALTTSLMVDVFENDDDVRLKNFIYAGMSGLFVALMGGVYYGAKRGWLSENVVTMVLGWAAYTYGPLLGLFAFGMFTRRTTRDRFVPYVCLASPMLTYALFQFLDQAFGYRMGYETVVANGLLTFAGLWAAGIGAQSRAYR
jgi:Na+/proline symporter